MSEKIDPSQTNNASAKLRAMGFGELLDTTFSLYRTHFWSFLGIAAGYFIAMGIGVSICFFDDSAGRAEMITIWVPTIVAIFGVSLFVVSGLVFATAQAYLGKSIRIGVVLGRAGRQFFRCFVGSLLYAVLAVLFTALLILPLGGMLAAIRNNESLTLIFGLVALLLIGGIVICFVTYWCFFVAAILIEERSMWIGLRRRRELIGRTWWQVIGTMCAIFLLSSAIDFVFRFAFGSLLTLVGLVEIEDIMNETIRWIAVWGHFPIARTEFSLSYMLIYVINLGVGTFTLPIWVIGCTLLYFDQRIRKEGFDIEMMATYQEGDSDARTI